MYNTNASVNRFSKVVFVTASVNRKRTPLLMLGINRGVFFLCTPQRPFSSASQNPNCSSGYNLWPFECLGRGVLEQP